MKSSSTKCGFSLIELMVVLVILGVLAAIAVPKLFGQMAKAKATELYAAAGNYIHLQDAYNTEYQQSIGSWKTIGYAMKSSVNFKYYEGDDEGGNPAASTVSISDGETAAWKAVSSAILGECAVGSIWKIDVIEAVSKAYNLEYKVAITGGANGECEVLTKHFSGLDTDNHIIDTP